jgi:hypothetical protein
VGSTVLTPARPALPSGGVIPRCYACGMASKPCPNRRLYVQALRRLTPEQRLLKAFELTDLSDGLLRDGLRRRFPSASDQRLHGMFLERLQKCHNRRS